MSMKVKQFIIISLLLFIFGGMINTVPIQAASAEVTIEADSNKVMLGDSVFVYVKINSNTSFGDFEANLVYDEDIFEYQGGASVISGGSGFLRISDMGVLDGDNSRKYTLKFKAIGVGMSTLAFNDRAMVYDFSSGYEMSVSSNELTMNVEAPVTASDNAYLKSLKINPSTISPEFNKSVYEYQADVSYDTEKLVITALPEDEKAAVSITGNENLSEGENKVVVSVVAESGAIIKYTIKVTREKAPAATPTVTPIVTSELLGSSFEIVTQDGEEYIIFSGQFKLVEPSSDVSIPTGYKEGSLIVEGVSINAYLPIDYEESEYLLIYAMNDKGETSFYRYDRVEKTMLRYVPDSLLINENTSTDEEELSALKKEYNQKLKKSAIVIAILSAFCGVLIFIVVRLVMKRKHRRR